MFVSCSAGGKETASRETWKSFFFTFQWGKSLNIKPLFHWKLRSQWPPSANEIDTKSMKWTWPMRAPKRGDQTQPIFRLLTLDSHWIRGCSLVSSTRKSHVGGITQRKGVCVAEYRLLKECRKGNENLKRFQLHIKSQPGGGQETNHS